MPARIIFGPGSLARLGAEARKIGQRAILVTGTSSLRQAGVLAACAVATAPWLKYHPRLLDVETVKQLYQDSY